MKSQLNNSMERSNRISYLVFICISFLFLIYIKFLVAKPVSGIIKDLFSKSEKNKEFIYQQKDNPSTLNSFDVKQKFSYNGKEVNVISPEVEYASAVVMPASEMLKNTKRVNVSFNCFTKTQMGEILVLAVHEDNSDKPKIWLGKEIREITSLNAQWNEIRYSFELPENYIPASKDLIKIYIWNRDRNTILYNELNVYRTLK